MSKFKRAALAFAITAALVVGGFFMSALMTYATMKLGRFGILAVVGPPLLVAVFVMAWRMLGEFAREVEKGR